MCDTWSIGSWLERRVLYYHTASLRHRALSIAITASAFGMAAADGIAGECGPLVGVVLAGHAGMPPVPRPFGVRSSGAEILCLGLIGIVHCVPKVAETLTD